MKLADTEEKIQKPYTGFSAHSVCLSLSLSLCLFLSSQHETLEPINFSHQLSEYKVLKTHRGKRTAELLEEIIKSGILARVPTDRSKFGTPLLERRRCSSSTQRSYQREGEGQTERRRLRNGAENENKQIRRKRGSMIHPSLRCPDQRKDEIVAQWHLVFEGVRS